GSESETEVPEPKWDRGTGLSQERAGLVPPAGIEPATRGLGNRCSSPLSYEGRRRGWQTTRQSLLPQLDLGRNSRGAEITRTRGARRDGEVTNAGVVGTVAPSTLARTIAAPLARADAAN